MESAGSNGQLDWGVAARAISGEQLSEDKHLVVPTTRGWLLAVVDGGMLAQDLFKHYAKLTTDDALMLVARRLLPTAP